MIETRILKDGSKSYRARVHYKGRVIATESFTRKGHAQDWHDRVLAHAKDPGRPTQQSRALPLGDHLVNYLAYREQHRAGRTATTDTSLLNSTLQPHVGVPINRFDRVAAQAVVDEYQRTHKASSTRRMVSSMSSFFKWCIKRGFAESNPIEGVEVGDDPEGASKSAQMPYADMAELLEVVADVRGHSESAADVVLFAALTGVRWGELRELRVMDVSQVPIFGINVRRSHPEGEVVRTVTKGKKDRFVPLHHLLHPMINKRLDLAAPEDLLFTAPRGGKLFAGNFRRDVMWKQRSRNRRIHQLRHTFCTFAVDAGVSLSTVQKWAGHAKLSTTVNMYVHSRGDDSDRAGLETLERFGATSHPRPAENSEEQSS